MDTNKRIFTAFIWGLCAIVAQVLFLMLNTVSHATSFNILLRITWLEFIIFLSVMTFAMHVWGYTYIGQKYNHAVLKYSARILTAVTLLFGIVVMTSIGFQSFGADHVTNSFMNGLIGIAFIIFVPVAIIFAVALCSLFRNLGYLVFLAGGLISFPVFFWYAWPTIMFLIPSIFLLYRESEIP